jgi:hypothetical protein
MTRPNKILLRTITCSWLAFMLIGWLISRVIASPDLVVLIDRSYCPAAQWQRISESYQALYQQYQEHQVRIKTIIIFSDLSEESFSTPPLPDAIRSLPTYGHSNIQRQTQLQTSYPNATLLSCQSDIRIP